MKNNKLHIEDYFAKAREESPLLTKDELNELVNQHSIEINSSNRKNFIKNFKGKKMNTIYILASSIASIAILLFSILFNNNTQISNNSQNKNYTNNYIAQNDNQMKTQSPLNTNDNKNNIKKEYSNENTDTAVSSLNLSNSIIKKKTLIIDHHYDNICLSDTFIFDNDKNNSKIIKNDFSNNKSLDSSKIFKHQKYTDTIAFSSDTMTIIRKIKSTINHLSFKDESPVHYIDTIFKYDTIYQDNKHVAKAVRTKQSDEQPDLCESLSKPIIEGIQPIVLTPQEIKKLGIEVTSKCKNDFNISFIDTNYADTNNIIPMKFSLKSNWQYRTVNLDTNEKFVNFIRPRMISNYSGSKRISIKNYGSDKKMRNNYYSNIYISGYNMHYYKKEIEMDYKTYLQKISFKNYLNNVKSQFTPNKYKYIFKIVSVEIPDSMFKNNRLDLSNGLTLFKTLCSNKNTDNYDNYVYFITLTEIADSVILNVADICSNDNNLMTKFDAQTDGFYKLTVDIDAYSFNKNIIDIDTNSIPGYAVLHVHDKTITVSLTLDKNDIDRTIIRLKKDVESDLDSLSKNSVIDNSYYEEDDFKDHFELKDVIVPLSDIKQGDSLIINNFDFISRCKRESGWTISKTSPLQYVINFSKKDLPESYFKDAKTKNNISGFNDNYISQFIQVNKLVPVTVKLCPDDSNANKTPQFILWFDPTDELVNRLPESYCSSLVNELNAAQDTTVLCEVPTIGERAFFDIWRACNGVIKNTRVYPNPANSTITVNFELDQARQIVVSIYDVQGKLVKNLSNYSLMQAGINKEDINISDIPSGLYLIAIQSNQNEHTVQRLIIEK